MHLHLHRTIHHRKVVSCEEMVKIYQEFHAALNDTYWDASSNHKVCQDAMAILKSTHISKKSSRFLLNFTALLREVYSHAHYNSKELLYEERDDVRDQYWREIENFATTIYEKIDKAWSSPHSHVTQKLSIALHFAALFSLYKDLADDSFITALYDRANECIQHHEKHCTATEKEHNREFFRAIDVIYHLRNTLNGGMSRRGTTTHVHPIQRKHQEEYQKGHTDSVSTLGSDGTTAEIGSETSTTVIEEKKKSEVDVNSNIPNITVTNLMTVLEPAIILPIPSTSRHVLEADLEPLTPTFEATLEDPPTPITAKRISSPRASREDGDKSKVVLPPDYKPTSVAETEIVGILRNLNKVEPNVASTPASPDVLPPFDPKSLFEQRLGKKRVSIVTPEIPVIKPNKEDVVHSYRRKGLFDLPESSRPRNHSYSANIDNMHLDDNKELEIPTPTSSHYKKRASVAVVSSTKVDEEETSETVRFRKTSEPPAKPPRSFSTVEPIESEYVELLSPNTRWTRKIVRAVIEQRVVSPLTPDHGYFHFDDTGESSI